MSLLDEIVKRRKKKIKDFMSEMDMNSYREIAIKSNIVPTNLATAMKDENYLSEKYVRKIEEAFNLCPLYFDLEEIIVENDVYTLDTFKEKKAIFRIKNTNGFKDCFYIHLLEDGFYKAESSLLFEYIDDNDTFKPELGKIYLIEKNDKYYIAKSMIVYFITDKKEKFETSEINILAKQIRAEV